MYILQPPWMAVVPNFESFAVRQNSKMKNVQDVHFSSAQCRQAKRKPIVSYLLSGLLLFRLPTVQLFALLFQLPPRLTRLEPDAAPYKVHTVF